MTTAQRSSPSATGTLNPVVSIQVGTQVSGTIQQLFVVTYDAVVAVANPTLPDGRILGLHRPREAAVLVVRCRSSRAAPASAAALFGLTPTPLESRIKKLGLQRPH